MNLDQNHISPTHLDFLNHRLDSKKTFHNFCVCSNRRCVCLPPVVVFTCFRSVLAKPLWVRHIFSGTWQQLKAFGCLQTTSKLKPSFMVGKKQQWKVEWDDDDDDDDDALEKAKLAKTLKTSYGIWVISIRCRHVLPCFMNSAFKFLVYVERDSYKNCALHRWLVSHGESHMQHFCGAFQSEYSTKG